MGYMRLEVGKNLLGIEGEVAWATPGQFTVHNFPCNEDGSNCVVKRRAAVETQTYVDPSKDLAALQRRMASIQGSSSSSRRVSLPKLEQQKQQRYVRS